MPVLTGGGGGGGGAPQTPWAADEDAAAFDLLALGVLGIGTGTVPATDKVAKIAPVFTASAGEHLIGIEMVPDATFDTTAAGSYINGWIVPTVTATANMGEVVGWQVQPNVDGAGTVTQIHGVEMLPNNLGCTATLMRAGWGQIQTNAGTTTLGISFDAEGYRAAGSGTFTEYIGLRVRSGKADTGAIVTVCGIDITDLAVGTTKWAMRVGNYQSYHHGPLKLGAASAPNASLALDVAGNVGLGTTGVLLAGVTSPTAGLGQAIELNRTEATLSNVGRTGIYIEDHFTWTTGGASASYAGVSINPVVSIASGQTLTSMYGMSFVPNASGAGALTSMYGVYSAAQSIVSGGTTLANAGYFRVSTGLGTITTGVGVDIASSDVTGFGTITTMIGLRITDLAEGATKWAMQVGNYQSYHEGNLRVGAITGGDTNAPQAKLDVIQQTLGNEVQRLSTVATNDDVRERVIQGRVTTTDATVTTVFSTTAAASTTAYVEADVYARRTGGTGGTAEDAAAYKLYACIKNVTGTATIVGAVLADFTAESQAAWDATIAVSGNGILVRVTGAVNNNITWHAIVRIREVGS